MSAAADAPAANAATEPEVAKDTKDVALTVDLAAAAPPAGPAPAEEAGGKQLCERVKRAREAAKTLERALASDAPLETGEEAAEEPPAKKAAVEAAAAEAAPAEAEAAPAEAEAAPAEAEAEAEAEAPPTPPVVRRQMATLSPPDMALPAPRREATVAA